MPDRMIATLAGTELPRQFKYTPPSPNMRHSIVPTYGGSVLYTPDDGNINVLPDQAIEWNIPGAIREEYNIIENIFTSNFGAKIIFEGYWGVHTVFFVQFDNPDVERSLYNISGVFRVATSG